jgi:glycosyltransferase involved in cell wall biosynthesis
MNNRNLRIAILGPSPSSSGGIRTNIQHMLRSPLKKVYDFFPFQTGSPKYGTAQYLNERIYTKIYRVVSSLISFTIYLSKYSPDIVHANTSFGRYSFWRDSMYILITKLLGRRILLQIHGGELYEFWQKNTVLSRKLIKKVLEIPAQILVLSSAQYKPFEDLCIQQKVNIIPNMIDASRFCDKDKRNCKRNLDRLSDHIIVLFVAAHFYKEKGVWEVLKAIPLVVKEHEKTHFILVGGGIEENGMRNFCSQKGLQNYVRFTGYLSGEDIIKIFLASDIFVFPTYYSEGFPLVILEAMAAGLPVISTPVRAIPEIIKDDVNGFLIQPKDHIALAEKISWLIKNRSLLKSIGRNNRIKVKEKYDLEPVAKIFDKIYRELITERS